jgi:hypothetical protein
MKSTLTEVIARREALVARAAAQRAELGALVERHRVLLGVADTGYRVGRALARYPLLTFVAAVLLFKTQRRRVLFWGGQLLTLWELYQVFRGQAPARGGR